MISAFGVVHKSFNKLGPKLAQAESAMPGAFSNKASMDQRIKGNYAFLRHTSGNTSKVKNYVFDPGKSKAREIPKQGPKPGPEALKYARQDKDVARAMVTAAGNRSKRKGRVLP